MDSPIEVALYLKDPSSAESVAECKRVAAILQKAGALAIRDPRVTFEDNKVFIDELERYFGQDESAKLVDARPELHYQVGVTPEGTEIPRCASDASCKDMIAQMKPENRAHVPTGADHKWRFFHRIGPRPANTKFGELNATPVHPKAFVNWNNIMEAWGSKMLQAAFTIAEMAALGFGVDKTAFTRLMTNGPHLLAPTASDLEKYGAKDTILAGFHRDLNFLTVHGKSRYPGLDIWLRDGTKFPVSIPDGCLLAQAGMQFEHLTGGLVVAGWHEVWVNEKTVLAIVKAREEGRSLWRISSTLFSHIASDNTLEPVVPGGDAAKYAAILAGDQVSAELDAIKLHAGSRVVAM